MVRLWDEAAVELEVGARRSVSKPKTMRAMVEVTATIETWVAAEVGMTVGLADGE